MQGLNPAEGNNCCKMTLSSLTQLPRAAVTLRDRAGPRLFAGHPWIYRNEIASVETRQPAGAGVPSAAATTGGAPFPAVAEVRDQRGRFVGTGFLSPVSTIAVRLVSGDPGLAIDDELFRARARRALALRRPILDGAGPRSSCCRLVFAEGDGIPGLIVDKFGPALVFQSLALAAEAVKDAVLAELAGLLDPGFIVERNDAPVRDLEGLPQRAGLWPDPAAPPPDGGLVEVDEDGLRMKVHVLEGQKTGYYLDQRENRRLTRTLAGRLAADGIAADRGVDVLDCFAYTGGFGVAAAKGAGGALGRLLMIDDSAPALEMAAGNLALNGVRAGAELVCGNAFDQLRRMDRESRTGGPPFDLIVLDPPPFARERRMIPGALRGYKEINLRAMRLLRRGGYLVTSTCSHHVGLEAFRQVLSSAAADAGARMRVVAANGQPADHPVMLGFPEGDYLRCLALQRVDGLIS